MSLSIARYAAYSALTTTQSQISVSSANIANADTDGYTKKTATQASTTSNGIGTGTTITGITSNVDKLLLKQLNQAESALGAATVTDSYASQLQSAMGSVSGSDGTGTSIANSLASLASALSQLADTPESTTLQSQFVTTLDDLAAQLRDTSASIQDLRSSADQEIGSDVDEANDLLDTIDDLNKQIMSASASGNSTADLEDQRNQALKSLSSLMDINYYSTSSGAVQVYTSGGTALLDGTVHHMSFDAAGTVTAASTYSASGSSALSGITVDGKDITGEIKSGSIAALVEQRDETLPAVQAELDQLAVQLANALNSVANTGSASPPPNSLTGSTAVSAADAFSGTGTVRIAVTDDSGNLVSYQDLDLSSYATVGDLVSALDNISGVSASVGADGRVTIAAESAGNGIAINELTSAVGADGEGLSSWLGLNDIVSATGASDFAVKSSLLADTSLLPVSTLDDTATLATGAQVVAEGSSTIAQQLYDTLTGNQAFDAAGDLSARKTSFSSYASTIISEVAADATSAATALTTKQTIESNLATSISSASGVNIDEETARLSQLQNEYAAAAQLVQILNSMFESLLGTLE
ncbi:flagellar hook-associated protein FlgK [Pseudolabrys sp. FHR47]|uniref:flagellar hook-associated protein FlgK n=1 Tax=Pseudolabrys sp. FHR47 TaxID=2562284 RepID=UPI0010BF06CE|nr:flagellar hook-associated protein FlgK [Pseudolabrys sp. FHR47]